MILILVDTLRADHLGCYGYSRPTSAFIDSLAGEGLYDGNPSPLYDAELEAAVRAYQLRAGLTADGIAGPKTLCSLRIQLRRYQFE